jgi:hypothetical protein
MIREERQKVLQGFVNYRNQWMSIEKKMDLDSQRRKKIEQGYVQHNGEWITIDEKISRMQPKPPVSEGQKQVFINNTINRQVYNIQNTVDNRSFQSNVNEHRHVHIDQPASGDFLDYPIVQNEISNQDHNKILIQTDHQSDKNKLTDHGHSKRLIEADHRSDQNKLTDKRHSRRLIETDRQSDKNKLTDKRHSQRLIEGNKNNTIPLLPFIDDDLNKE